MMVRVRIFKIVSVSLLLLAVGISEALVNTAGGLTAAIVGIVAYNFFVNKVDSFNYTIDEASYEVVQLLKSREARTAGA